MVNLNILDLFLKTSSLIKFNILILVFFSIISWAIIIQKIRILNSATCEAELFESKFWSGIELFCLYQESQKHCDNLSGIEHIFYIGFKEFTHLYQENSNISESIVKGAYRVMCTSINHELEILEKYIPFLKSIGSISPYIGLLGTVWGVMNAFTALGSEQVNLEIIAPGIAEALISTGIGLFVAIPSVMAYDYLNQCLNKLELNYSNFMEEFIAILHRQVFSDTKKEKR